MWGEHRCCEHCRTGLVTGWNILRNEEICHHSARANKNFRPHPQRVFELGGVNVIKIDNYYTCRFRNSPNLTTWELQWLFYGHKNFFFFKKDSHLQSITGASGKSWVFLGGTCGCDNVLSLRDIKTLRLCISLHLPVSLLTVLWNYRIPLSLHLAFEPAAAHVWRNCGPQF